MDLSEETLKRAIEEFYNTTGLTISKIDFSIDGERVLFCNEKQKDKTLELVGKGLKVVVDNKIMDDEWFIVTKK